MKRFTKLSSVATLGLLALGTLTLTGPMARACDECKAAATGKTVTTYEVRHEGTTKWVTLYDASGRAYQVSRTCVRDVPVPVTYRIMTTYETRREARTKLITLYDACGKSYQVRRTCYRGVPVPVVNKVLVSNKLNANGNVISSNNNNRNADED